MWRRGRPIPLVACATPVPLAAAFAADGAPVWEDLGRPLEGVYINVGENGLFSRAEFETVTALGSMEFITPEEVADYVMLELSGRPTGRDVWIRRAAVMVQQADARRPVSEESGSDVHWSGIGADDPVDPARFAAWVFAHEDMGERIKR